MNTLPFEETVLRAHDFGAMMLTLKLVQDSIYDLRMCQLAEDSVAGLSQEWIDAQTVETQKTEKEAMSLFAKAADQLEIQLGIVA